MQSETRRRLAACCNLLPKACPPQRTASSKEHPYRITLFTLANWPVRVLILTITSTSRPSG